MADNRNDEEMNAKGEDSPASEKPDANATALKIDDIDVFAERFREVSPELAWVPGVIEVVFKDAKESGIEDWNFAEEDARKNLPEAWTDELKNLLEANGLETWKPSFPLRYPWTEAASDEKARDDYKSSGRDKFVTFSFPRGADTREIAQALQELPEIEKAVAVPRVGAPSGPFDEPLLGRKDEPEIIVCDTNGDCLGSQWYIFRCKINLAWKEKNALGERISGNGVVIADIDWGFNPDHQDLIPVQKTQNVLLGAANSTNVANGNRCHHGTAALGLAGARVNTLGLAGIAFGAELWAVQAGLDDIEDHPSWVAGLNFVRTEASPPRKVIILEVETITGGNIEMIPTIAHEIKMAIKDNVVVCVPAGNRGTDAGIGDDNNPIEPTGSILVGATSFDAFGNSRGISNGGCRVIVYAPGDRFEDVTCGLSNDEYVPGFGGTSSAVAKVAGVVALMLETNPNLTHSQVRDILKRSTIPVVDDLCGEPSVLLDAHQAVRDAASLR